LANEPRERERVRLANCRQYNVNGENRFWDVSLERDRVMIDVV